MAASPPPRPSPLALTVLFMLLGGPLHPYEMQRRMKLWGKDQVVNLAQRASLYKTIERLRQAGLIAVRQTERDQRFPERTVYELTDAGLRRGREWLIEMLSTPRNEFPRFPAALSFVFGLTPDEEVVFQSNNADKHRDAAIKLLAEGKAYRDFTPKEDEGDANVKQAIVDRARQGEKNMRSNPSL